jgi:hypothetical protein
VAIPSIVPLMAGVELLDENVAFETGSSYADYARRTGALTMLPAALVALARVYVRRGRFEDAEVALTEVTQIVRATGAPGSPDISAELQLHLLWWRGDEAGALAVADALTASTGRPEAAFDLASADLAVLDLSKGRYRRPFERLEPITAEDRLGFGTLMLADFIEAAVRCGEHAAAVVASSVSPHGRQRGPPNWGSVAWPARERCSKTTTRGAASRGEHPHAGRELSGRTGENPPRVRGVTAAPTPAP